MFSLCEYIYESAICMDLQSERKVTALCVSDQTGRHGTVGAPAPLQITHGVLVQVACCHQRAAWPQTSRRELQTTLSCQETVKKETTETPKKGTTKGERRSYPNTACILPQPDLLGVMLRNIFNPMRGPSMSPAPNSTCRDKTKTKVDIDACMCKTKLMLHYPICLCA